MTFPHGVPQIFAHYGNPFDYIDRKADWEALTLATRTLRYPLPYAYRADLTVTRIRAHRLIVDPLVELLAKAVETGVPLKRLRYGGCYVFRAMRASPRLSTHAWGIAVDLDPTANPMGVPHDPSIGLPMAVVELFEGAGWTWGGRWTRPDAMHFQAAAGY